MKYQLLLLCLFSVLVGTSVAVAAKKSNSPSRRSQREFILELTLDRTNHSGFRIVDVLSQSKSQYNFNGKDLGKTLPLQILKAWGGVIKADVSQTQLCSSGKFVLTMKEPHRERHLRGCTDGIEYGRLIQNIEEIRNYAKGN